MLEGFKIGLLMVVTCGPGSEVQMHLWISGEGSCPLSSAALPSDSILGPWQGTTWEWSGGTNGDLFPMVLA